MERGGPQAWTNDPSQIPSLEQINLLRLTRSNVVKLQANYFPNILAGIIQGCFVRVLLEANDGRRQMYRVARVSGTRTGEEYSGYSFNHESTTTYLDLDVPHSIGHTTDSIQLNSISNSDFLQEEYELWVEAMTKDPKIHKPTVRELEQKWRDLRPHLLKAQVDVTSTRCDIFSTRLAGKTPRHSSDSGSKKRRLSEPPTGTEDTELREQVAKLQDMLKKRKDFPVDIRNLSMDELHKLEDKVQDYMMAIRLRKKDLTHCKICMEKDVDVVLLPCKHQILCQDCSFQIEVCPVCRQAITDRILPHKF